MSDIQDLIKRHINVTVVRLKSEITLQTYFFTSIIHTVSLYGSWMSEHSNYYIENNTNFEYFFY
jgi:hypothetical protein